jgi:glycosyltransferase involved in cell wall biosynthesis
MNGRASSEVNGSRISTRVLIVEQGEGLWGAQRYLLRLAPLMEARGFHQILAAPQGCAVAQAWREAGRAQVDLTIPHERSVRAADGDLSAKLLLRETARSLRVAVAIARLARGNDAHLIHANSHWSHGEAVVASKLARMPSVLHLHEESEPDMVGRLRGLAVMGADTAIAVSGAVARALPRRAERRTVVIRNGVDATSMLPGAPSREVRAEMSSDTRAPLVLALSRLDPRKGVDNVIRAVALLPPHLSDVRLAVAGAPSVDPGNGDRLRRLGVELLGERVRFLGARSDVAELLRSADALILASTLEGLPLSILEAQACGLPVVAYPTAGVPEVVTHEQTGLLAAPGDVADLSRQLARLLDDQGLRARLSQGARRQVLQESTLETQADRQAALLRRVLDHNEQARCAS